jgi:hypothetical protein
LKRVINLSGDYMGNETFKLKLMVLLGFIAIALAMSGCSSQGRSMGLGGGIGAGTGALLGGIVDPGKKGEYRTRNIIIGGAVGGLAGTLTGWAVHNNTEKEKELAYYKGRDSKSSEAKPKDMPKLHNPKVEAQWIEGRIVGNRYVDGHFEYVITEPARWETEE